jgi:hypothetical protein
MKNKAQANFFSETIKKAVPIFLASLFVVLVLDRAGAAEETRSKRGVTIRRDGSENGLVLWEQGHTEYVPTPDSVEVRRNRK